MTGATADGPPAAAGHGLSPFVVFGAVAAAAIGGAIFEMLYYVTAPGLEGAAIGTTGGILVAVVVFFGFALTAPPNE